MIRRNAALLTAVFFFASVGTLHAQSTAADADADRLFKEGQKLMEEHRYADACPKLESAYHQDKQLGTLLNLAYCHKEMGSTWVAWTEFREAEAMATKAGRKDRADFAIQRMKELEKNLSKLVVDPTAKVAVTEVDLEDRKIWNAEKNTPFAAEPGQRKLTFKSDGRVDTTMLVDVKTAKENGNKPQHVQVPDMADAPPPPPAPEPTPVAAQTTTTVTTPSTERSSWSTQKTLGVAAGAVGIAGLAVGAIFGVTVLGKPCTDGNSATYCSQSDHDSTSTRQTISTIGIIAGGALLAGGVVLFITAPSGKTTGARETTSGPTVQANLGPTWAGLHGTF